MSSFKVLENDTGLQVTGLRKSYRKRIIIHDISLELNRGEVVALLGPNGSGKTTTFYSIAGLTSSDGGQVKIDGMDVTTMPMYRRARMGLSYLPQETSIFRGLNVEDNIKSILDISTPLKSERQAKLEKLLSDFRIEHLRRTPALALSGGERRRVEIARTLATDPKYILLDEPFAGVDPISVNDVRNLVSELKSRSIGVLITDHNVRDTLKIVDRAYILHDGRVIVSGLPEDVVNNDNVRRVYLGNDFNIL
ncbi:MAG: LPS export ABC transporter ATP-binding protein [Paracoccaceae bacterium]